MQTPPTEDPVYLGFSYRSRKTGDVEVLHHRRVAATLRDRDAIEFMAEAPDSFSPDAQQLMARFTGNYKRGNERLARSHPQNRR